MLNPGRVGTRWSGDLWFLEERGVSFRGQGQAEEIATCRTELGLIFVLLL